MAGRMLLTEKVAKKIAKHVEKGNRFYTACALVGILEDTGRHWLSEGRKWPNSPQGRFAQAIELAYAKAEDRAQKRIQRGIKQSWVAAAWWLTHGPSKSGWAAKNPQTSIKASLSIRDQITPKLSGMSGKILEAEYERLDTNMKMIEQQAANVD